MGRVLFLCVLTCLFVFVCRALGLRVCDSLVVHCVMVYGLFWCVCYVCVSLCAVCFECVLCVLCLRCIVMLYGLCWCCCVCVLVRVMLNAFVCFVCNLMCAVV